MTANHNLVNNINQSVAEELEVEYLYLSEHIKCRPTHFPWQGTIIKRQDLVKITKLGEVDGMGGANCKHYPIPYFGTARGNELKKISLEEVTKQYELSQKQRYIERGIRKWKRKERIFKNAEDKEYYKKCKDKVKEWQLRAKKFTEDNDLRRDFTRENVERVTKVKNDDIITTNNLLNKLGINVEEYDAMKSNNIQERASQLLKMDNKPIIVNKSEYDKEEGTEIVRYLRNYKKTTAEEAYNNTLYGDIQYSDMQNSQYGRGIYFGEKSTEEELSYTFGNGKDVVINAKLCKDANILEFNSMIDYIRSTTEITKSLPPELRKVYEKERSLIYMLKGYDGIKIKNKKYYNIYNRKVLIIKNE